MRTMAYGPMTFIIVVLLVICCVVVALLLGRGGVNDPLVEPKRCPRCQCANPRRARYCAGCGQKLDGS